MSTSSDQFRQHLERFIVCQFGVSHDVALTIVPTVLDSFSQDSSSNLLSVIQEALDNRLASSRSPLQPHFHLKPSTTTVYSPTSYTPMSLTPLASMSFSQSKRARREAYINDIKTLTQKHNKTNTI
ncbi:hypothetical protein GEMRC1_003847 [Eukaryota sp. GEM-RC1]